MKTWNGKHNLIRNTAHHMFKENPTAIPRNIQNLPVITNMIPETMILR